MECKKKNSQSCHTLHVMSLLFDMVYVSFLILHSSPLSPQVLHFLPSCVHAYLTYTCPPVLPTPVITCSTGALLAACIYDLLPLLLCHSVVVSLLLHCTLITAVFYINYFYSYLFGFYLLKSPRCPPPSPLFQGPLFWLWAPLLFNIRLFSLPVSLVWRSDNCLSIFGLSKDLRYEIRGLHGQPGGQRPPVKIHCYEV